MTLRTLSPSAIALLMLTACGESSLTVQDPGSDPDTLMAELSSELSWSEAQSLLRGAKVFTTEKFGGNDRTCVTCHSLSTGTVTPAEANRRFARDRRDPLFRAIDSDQGDGASYSLLLRDATVNVTLPLPPNVYIAEDPTARSVTLRRGIPSTQDAPALDPFLMLDMRNQTLQDQAAGAIHGHAEASLAPTSRQLDDVAFFQQSVLFSSRATLAYARGGPTPTLPTGRTASERRGREFFVGEASLCGQCHSGPLLNGQTGPDTGPEMRASDVGISEFNYLDNPVLTYVFVAEDGTETAIQTPDPGVGLTFGEPMLVNVFKMTSLRNLKNTAPYFHDNSLKTLEEVVEHYDVFINMVEMGDLSDQDKADLVAFMKLL
ncbi:MAG: hypothetical protein M3Y59_09310 [Myxococcota bacterium]|nr:hypothetical protein [Myxococcota bacterium]